MSALRRFLLASSLSALVLPMATQAGERSASPPSLPVTGAMVPELRALDELMIRFVGEHELPGAALAVAKGGRVVYARGFGHADVESRTPVQPEALFRIASISKPITAVAVLQLVENGCLRLETPVFEVLADRFPLPDRHAPPWCHCSVSSAEGRTARRAVAPGRLHEPPLADDCDPRLKQVTVAHCLGHTGGWDSARSFDPMFRSVIIAREQHVPPPARPEHIIRYMLHRQLDFPPGERYAYSNFGYSLLGRVIEAVSGEGYASYVRRHVLCPLGITRMQLGRTLREHRADGEVTYYAGGHYSGDEPTGPAVTGPRIGEPVPHPYGAWSVEGFDAHGGWLASAVDLVRFGAAFERPECSPLLRVETIRTMFARPAGRTWREEDGRPKPWYYACGWNVRPVGTEGRFNAWHAGGLPGTSTLLVHRHDDVTFAVLFNTDKEIEADTDEEAEGQPPAKAIDPLLHEAIDQVRRWPSP